MPRSRTTSRGRWKINRKTIGIFYENRTIGIFAVRFMLYSVCVAFDSERHADNAIRSLFGLHWSTKVRTMTGKFGCKNTQLKQSKITLSLTTSNALIVGFSNHIKLIHISLHLNGMHHAPPAKCIVLVIVKKEIDQKCSNSTSVLVLGSKWRNAR